MVDLKRFNVVVTRAEILDETTIKAVHNYGSCLWIEPRPALFLEFSGSPAAVAADLKSGLDLCAERGALMIKSASEEAQRNELWKARHSAYYAAMHLRPGCTGWPTDVCVPLSALAQVIMETTQDLNEFGIVAPIFGHAGDGNFHVILLHHPDDGDKGLAKLEHFNARLVERALKAGGTCTGEHGVGFGKAGWLEKELGVEGVNVLKRIKLAMDPFKMLNPGKVVDLW